MFFTFTWGGRKAGGHQETQKAPRRDARKDGAKGGPRGDASKGKPKDNKGKKGPKPQQGARRFEARPEKKKDRIDPDNPFAAALMGLKDKS